MSAGSVPFTVHLERPRVERILKLKAGRHRFFRALMLWAPLPSVVTVGAASGLVAAVWINGWGWAHVYAVINRVVTELLTFDAVIECIRLIRLRYVAAIALPWLITWLASREAYTKWVWPAA